MNNRMKDSVKTAISRLSPSQRAVLILCLGGFTVLALSAGLQYGAKKMALPFHGQRCKFVKEDRFCDAVNTYYGNSRTNGLRAQKVGELLVFDYPGTHDTDVSTFNIYSGKMVKLCGFWIGLHTQKGPCLEGEALDAYLDEMKKKRR